MTYSVFGGMLNLAQLYYICHPSYRYDIFTDELAVAMVAVWYFFSSPKDLGDF